MAASKVLSGVARYSVLKESAGDGPLFPGQNLVCKLPSQFLAARPQAHFDMNDYVVKEAPDQICYIPNFMSAENQALLLKEVRGIDESQWEPTHMEVPGWVHKGAFSALILEKDFPDWVVHFVDLVAQVDNLYPDGSGLCQLNFHKYDAGAGMFPHRDDVENRPVQWIHTLESAALLDFYQPVPENNMDSNGHERFLGSMLLEPGSLMLLRGDLNENLMHGIKQVEYDVIHEKVWNRPLNMPVGTKLPRRSRVSITNGNKTH